MRSVLPMEPALLHHSLPIHGYQPVSSEHEYGSQYAAHPHHHQSYATNSSVDPLRRDGSAILHGSSPFAFAATNSTSRYMPDRGMASDTNSFQGSNTLVSSNNGSISTSPSSAVSPLTYTNYQQNHCTSIPTYSGAVQLPQTFVQGSYSNDRVNPILDGASAGMLPPSNPMRTTIPSTTHANDCDTYASSTSFLARNPLSTTAHVAYGPYPDTPRNALSISALPLSGPSYTNVDSHMASHAFQQNECENFPWPNLEIHADMTCAGKAVTPDVHAKVEKGFFKSTVDQKWTCYRRNYFSVQCHFELYPNINHARVELKRGGHNNPEQVQAMGMRLSAAVDGSAGKGIELVQHTPKRDAGPKNKIEVVKVAPTPPSGRGDHTVANHGIYQVPSGTFHATGQVAGPLLPFQNTNESGSSSGAGTHGSHLPSNYPYGSTPSQIPLPVQQVSHTFERVQFKQATANNGKRRASQQYFHLIVELFADVRKDSSDDPIWVKVAHRVSEKIVVRGRSPSHYQNEGQNGQGGRTGSTGGSSGYATAGGATYGSLSVGGFCTPSSGLGGNLVSGTYRTNTYGFHPSPGQSGSSNSSVDGGVAESEYHGDAVMSDVERNDIHGHEGYRYYPATIYEGVTPGISGNLPLPKIESTARLPTDPSSWAGKVDYSDAVSGAQCGFSGLGRFQGVDSSRGYFPDLTSNYT